MSRRVRVAVLALLYLGACTATTHFTGFDHTTFGHPSWGASFKLAAGAFAGSLACMLMLFGAVWWVYQGKP
jgi:hypothetical protein